MLQAISNIVHIPFSEDIDTTAGKMLARIRSKIANGVDESHPAFDAIVRKAEEDVNLEGQRAIDAFVAGITAPPPERVYKIRPSLKGSRIKVAAACGVRFSFGPVWNESVIKGKGIALVPLNRNKLNHQALMAGIEGAEEMDVKVLCAAIAKTLTN